MSQIIPIRPGVIVDTSGKPRKLNNAQRLLVSTPQLKQVILTFFMAPSQEGPWEMVGQDKVPMWCQEPRSIIQFMAGNMAQDENYGPEWYRAEQVEQH